MNLPIRRILLLSALAISISTVAPAERFQPWNPILREGAPGRAAKLRELLRGPRPTVEPGPTPAPLRPPGREPTSFDVRGTASVIDGDTLEIGETTIRIHGIDAPEAAQTCCQASRGSYSCGDRATEYMQMLVLGESVGCRRVDTDQYGRMVARCFSDGLDLGYEMVWAGWALAYRRFSSEYVGAEASAMAAQRGLWAGTFLDPAAWRSGERSCVASPTARPTVAPTPRPSARPSPSPTMRPTPRPTPTMRHTPRPTARPTSRPCCRVCTTGKACGDSCISRDHNCSRPPGCACNG